MIESSTVGLKVPTGAGTVGMVGGAGKGGRGMVGAMLGANVSFCEGATEGVEVKLGFPAGPISMFLSSDPAPLEVVTKITTTTMTTTTLPQTIATRHVERRGENHPRLSPSSDARFLFATSSLSSLGNPRSEIPPDVESIVAGKVDDEDDASLSHCRN